MIEWKGLGKPPEGRVKVYFRRMSWGVRQGRRSCGKISYTGDASIFDWEHRPDVDGGREDITEWEPAGGYKLLRKPSFRVTLTIHNAGPHTIAAKLAQKLGREATHDELTAEVRRIIHEANT
jgi:hypothetical protein